jgi:hypothetical protein
LGRKHNRRHKRAELSAQQQPPGLTLTSAESKGESKRSSSTTEPGNPHCAETDETVSPLEDQANADPDSHAAHDAVSEICDAEGAADAHQHGVAELDGAHQSQTEGVEQTEADQQAAANVAKNTGHRLPDRVTASFADPPSAGVADNSREPSTNAYGISNAAVVELRFPRCDAAVRTLTHDTWELADAIVAECSEPGPNGVRNDSHAKINAMREEIARNHGIDLSFERVRKLRKVAAAFPPGRRRPAVCLEAHLEAGSPQALDDTINRTPPGVAITRAHVRSLTHPNEAEEKEKRNDERRHQIADQRLALQNICRDLGRQRDEREAQYLTLCRELGREPVPFDPVSAKDASPTSLAEDLDQSLRALLLARGFDPTTAEVTVAIDHLVQVALAQK